MRWYFTAAFALFGLAIFCRSVDSKSAVASGGVQKDNAATGEQKKTMAEEAHLDAAEKKADDRELLASENLASATKKQGEALDVNANSETEQRQQDPRKGGGNRKNRYRMGRQRRHRNRKRYRYYKRNFHNQKDYYYLKKIIDPDTDMVQDVATLDDVITLDAADEDLPKKRKKRNAKNQNDDDSCSDSDSDDDD